MPSVHPAGLGLSSHDKHVNQFLILSMYICGYKCMYIHACVCVCVCIHVCIYPIGSVFSGEPRYRLHGLKRLSEVNTTEGILAKHIGLSQVPQQNSQPITTGPYLVFIPTEQLRSSHLSCSYFTFTNKLLLIKLSMYLLS